MSTALRLDRLVGREVYTTNNRRLGRLHEFRAEQKGKAWVIGEFVIGSAGLLERLGLAVHLILGLKHSAGYVARWDQLDLSDPDRPRLTCRIQDLQKA